MNGWENRPGDRDESRGDIEHPEEGIADALREIREMSPEQRERKIGPHLSVENLRSAAEGALDFRRRHGDNVHLAWCRDCRNELYNAEKEHRERLRDAEPLEFRVMGDAGTAKALMRTRFFAVDLCRRSDSVFLRIVCDEAEGVGNVRVGTRLLDPPAATETAARADLEFSMGQIPASDADVEVSVDYYGGTWTRRVRFLA